MTSERKSSPIQLDRDIFGTPLSGCLDRWLLCNPLEIHGKG